MAAFLSFLCRKKGDKFVNTVVDDDLDLALQVKVKIQAIYSEEMSYLRMFINFLFILYNVYIHVPCTTYSYKLVKFTNITYRRRYLLSLYRYSTNNVVDTVHVQFIYSL